MPSVVDLAKTEAMLGEADSGTSSENLDTIRSSKGKMSGGGAASGPVSFMRGLDAFAGVSGRAASSPRSHNGHPRRRART